LLQYFFYNLYIYNRCYPWPNLIHVRHKTYLKWWWQRWQRWWFNDDNNDDDDDDDDDMMVYIIISYTSIRRKKMSYKIKYIIRKALKAEKKRERVREVELLISSRPWNKSTFYYWRLATKTAGLDRPTTAAASTRTTLHPRDHSRPAIQSSAYGKLYFINSFIVRMYRYAPNTQHNNNRD
jgi:hypothetical protein